MREMTVEQVCARIIDYRGKTPAKSGSGVRLITAKVVKDGLILDEPAEYIAADYYDEWMRRGLPQQWDVLITTEAPLGETAILRTSERVALAQRIILLRGDPRFIEQRYLFYTLRSPLVQSRLAARATGTTVLGIKQAELRKVLLPLPDLSVQRRIASTLGSYDDLIEVNRRRIALLEEMARRLFEEWFARAWSTGCGAYPADWRTGIADDLIDFDPPTHLPRTSTKPFVPMASLDTATSVIEGIEEREGGSGAKFRNGDTLFARITPCLENGKTGLVRDLPGDGVGFGSTEFIVMRGRVAGPAFAYLLARHAPFRAHAQRSMSGATGRQRARTESLRCFELGVPPRELLDRFEGVAWPVLEMVGRLGAANKVLAAARDHLLPRLISGELPVAAVERELEAAA